MGRIFAFPIKEGKWKGKFQWEKENGKESAMREEQWEEKMQREKGNVKVRCNKRREMWRKGTTREGKWEGNLHLQ